MKRDYKLFIKDIISAMKSIEQFVEVLSLDEVREDDKTSSAVIKKVRDYWGSNKTCSG
jgi:uncharacterized protein with HEPN domain